MNREIKAYLSIYCALHPEEWLHVIPTLKFTHNNQQDADQLQTPFELLYGKSPVAIPTTFEHTKYPSIKEQINRTIKDREEALVTHKLTQKRIAERRKTCSFHLPKDKKYGLTPGILKPPITKKMAPKQKGLFEIEEVMELLTYQLKLPKDWKIHNMFHAVLLKPYTETDIHGENYT